MQNLKYEYYTFIIHLMTNTTCKYLRFSADSTISKFDISKQCVIISTISCAICKKYFHALKNLKLAFHTGIQWLMSVPNAGMKRANLMCKRFTCQLNVLHAP